ncbi:SMI1/KNR4 family protein [Antribacter gilvus]|uniref:SMI1/KNR4 family protein n=1 Tax=Antribacter gilvus TaxID=2304675 RepID=UPI000F785009|nr:SMI1/KNR4 family protein [Antribacter gilvus]
MIEDAKAIIRARILPHRSTATQIDWPLLEELWGHQFPADYKWFLSTYGPGVLEGKLTFHVPEAPDAKPSEGMAAASFEARAVWLLTGNPPDGIGWCGDPNLITWGDDENANLYCWDASGPADSWVTLVSDREDGLWRGFRLSFTELVAGLIEGRFGDFPFGPRRPEGDAPWRYIDTEAVREIWARGDDPWA